MDHISSDFSAFITRISALENELDALEKSVWTIAERYAGSVFPGQAELAADIENTGLAMTHETASQLGFYRERFAALVHFIEYRKAYPQFSDAETEGILDGTLTLKQKHALAKKRGSIAAMLGIVSEMQAQWKQRFGNRSYARARGSLTSESGLSPNASPLWSAYAEAETSRSRQEIQSALERFIQALKNLGPEESAGWAVAFAKASQSGREATPVRLPLFREIIFPALLAGYAQDDPESIRLLSGFGQLLYQSPECSRQLAETEQSEYGLLLKLHRLKPDDAAARKRLIDVIADNTEYALHELPLGVLYGHNGASIGECAELLGELDFLKTLLREEGRRDLDEWLAEARRHIAAYQHYLATRKSGDTFEHYLQTERAMPVAILRHTDEAFPGWVECELTDAAGKCHRFNEKAPVVSTLDLTPSAAYPRSGFIACRPVATWTDDNGRQITRVDTVRPWGVESTTGETQFTVTSETLVPLLR